MINFQEHQKKKQQQVDNTNFAENKGPIHNTQHVKMVIPELNIKESCQKIKNLKLTAVVTYFNYYLIPIFYYTVSFLYLDLI